MGINYSTKYKPLTSTSRGGNRTGRIGLDRANSGPSQNRAESKLARFFRTKILTAKSALKTGQVGLNSHFKAKKNLGGPNRTGLGHAGPGQIWPGFFRAKNLMAQPGPNFGRTGLAHRVGPILPPLSTSYMICDFFLMHFKVMLFFFFFFNLLYIIL